MSSRINEPFRAMIPVIRNYSRLGLGEARFNKIYIYICILGNVVRCNFVSDSYQNAGRDAVYISIGRLVFSEMIDF